MKLILVLVAILLIVSYFLTWVIKNFSTKNRILDIPNERSSHLLPTPRGGGLAIVIAWYIGISVLFFFGEVSRNLYFALLSGILLAAISLMDDVFNHTTCNKAVCPDHYCNNCIYIFERYSTVLYWSIMIYSQ